MTLYSVILNDEVIQEDVEELFWYKRGDNFDEDRLGISVDSLDEAEFIEVMGTRYNIFGQDPVIKNAETVVISEIVGAEPVEMTAL